MQSTKSNKSIVRSNGTKIFTCGCGKKYTSEPSLYNHEKSKHDGIRQPGTKMPLTMNSNKNLQGRPVSKVYKQQNSSDKLNDFRDSPRSMDKQNDIQQKDSPMMQDSYLEKSHFSNLYAIQLVHFYLGEQERNNILGFSSTIDYPSHKLVSDDKIEDIISKNSKQEDPENCNLFKILISDFQRLSYFISEEHRLEWINEIAFVFFYNLSQTAFEDVDIDQYDSSQINDELLGIIENYKKSALKD